MSEVAALFMDELANVVDQSHLDSKVEVVTVHVQIPVDTNAESQEYSHLKLYADMYVKLAFLINPTKFQYKLNVLYFFFCIPHRKNNFFKFYARTIQKDLFKQLCNYLFSTISGIHQDSFTCGCHGNLGSLDCWEILAILPKFLVYISYIWTILIVYQKWIIENVTTDFQDHYVIDLEEATDNM